MQKSEQINELATALAKAQGAIDVARKRASNPYFESKYADLASVREASQKALADNGLSFMVLPKATYAEPDPALVQRAFEARLSDPKAPRPKATAIIEATGLLMHSSGQWISTELAMRPDDSDPQGIGSTLTYIQRYLKRAMLDVATDDDDDGNAASGKRQEAPQATPHRQTPPKPTTAKPKATEKAPEAPATGTPRDRLADLARRWSGFDSKAPEFGGLMRDLRWYHNMDGTDPLTEPEIIKLTTLVERDMKAGLDCLKMLSEARAADAAGKAAKTPF